MSRKLDAAIAEALGKHVIESKYWPHYIINREDGLYHVPYYSSDGNAMLELDREMRERGFVLFMNRGPDGAVNAYYNKPINTSINKNEPLARALAAYKALTGKEWQDD